MIESIINYLETFPMWIQLIAFVMVLFIPFGIGVMVIYKLFKAERIKAGIVEIEMEDEKHEK